MDNLKLNITTAGNTWNPTLLAIQAKNYKITLYLVVDEDGNEKSEYEAEKDGRRFSATSPAELLGLIAMWEVRGDNWQYNHKTEPNLNEELAELAITYDQDGNIVEY
ncbi:conserved hypothetical protein [Hyella patelloides LEGE 07179]|uniref:Uncharacterized protein n=1 Tax=Hyella patelloides LEGE 07179 TaxID=945734 RepID=A0A563W0T0_9CYAN|nr:hypothetical protein [Hyella patelloides]VEP17227.1 conserved hypothetical protein [Hyella patelloides LEGE 07179]